MATRTSTETAIRSWCAAPPNRILAREPLLPSSEFPSGDTGHYQGPLVRTSTTRHLPCRVRCERRVELPRMVHHGIETGIGAIMACPPFDHRPVPVRISQVCWSKSRGRARPIEIRPHFAGSVPLSATSIEMDQSVYALQSRKPVSSLRIAKFLSRRYEVVRLIFGGTELAVLSKAGANALGRRGASAGSRFAERRPPERAPQSRVGYTLSAPVIFTSTDLGSARG